MKFCIKTDNVGANSFNIIVDQEASKQRIAALEANVQRLTEEKAEQSLGELS